MQTTTPAQYTVPGYPAGHGMMPCDEPSCSCRSAFLREAARDASERGLVVTANDMMRAAHFAAPVVNVPVYVDRETAYGSTRRLSRSIRVF